MSKGLDFVEPLFVPAGADAIIPDLKDAVAPDAKDAARAFSASDSITAFDRACQRDRMTWHTADMAAVAAMPIAAMVLSKTEMVHALASIAAVRPIVALVETVRGNAEARAIAAPVMLRDLRLAGRFCRRHDA